MSLGIRINLVDSGEDSTDFVMYVNADLVHGKRPSDALADAAEEAGKEFARWLLRHGDDLDRNFVHAQAAANKAYYESITAAFKR